MTCPAASVTTAITMSPSTTVVRRAGRPDWASVIVVGATRPLALSTVTSIGPGSASGSAQTTTFTVPGMARAAEGRTLVDADITAMAGLVAPAQMVDTVAASAEFAASLPRLARSNSTWLLTPRPRQSCTCKVTALPTTGLAN